MTEIQWLTGRYDGYGIIELPDGTLEVYGQRTGHDCLASCGTWPDAVNFMENDD
jgi:hypothetical protein